MISFGRVSAVWRKWQALRNLSFGRISRGLLSLANLPAVIAIIVIALLGIFADRQNRVVSAQELRTDVLAKVNLIGANLEGRINGNMQVVRGLAATIAAEPEVDQKRFSELAQDLLDADNELRSVSAAPNLVVAMVHPIEGNERELGFDIRSQAQQRASVLEARDTRSAVLAGPTDLAAGGKGFIGRFPVFVDTPGQERFWGVVSAAIDMDRLFGKSGFFEEQGLDIAVMHHEPGAAESEPFFGRPGILAENPVVAYVPLPSGGWEIAAVPRQGWGMAPENTWLLRGLIIIGGVLVVIPIAYAGRLYAERQRNYVALKRGEARSRRLSQRLELALDASHIGVWELDLETNNLFWDDRLYEIYGIRKTAKPRTYEDWLKTIHPDDVARADSDFSSQVTENRSHSSQYRIIWPDGTVRHIRTHAAIVHHPHDHPRMIGAEWDVTADVMLNTDLEKAKNLAETRSAELATAKARIQHNALHDSLTGLPNRRYLDEKLERLAGKGQNIALLHIDLDRFKQINDTLGHAAGDAILVHAARVLKQNVKTGDFVARIGGDEFAIASIVGQRDGELDEVARRIVQEMRRPVAYRGHQCRFSVSIGIAVEGGGTAIDPARLLVNADIALYRAKSGGRNRHEFFTEALQAEIIRNKKVADEILSGLERNEFVACYQPQFDARTLAIAGVEALARWAHPSEGLLRPNAFLAIAEELDVVSTLDRLVLEQALADFERWKKSGIVVPRMSVNVSARRLRDEDLIESLKCYDIPPGTLSFELLESIFLDETDDAISRNVERIKQLGIDIAIDDFGTGYASIVSLLNLKPRTLKIDRQLTLPVVTSARQRHLVQSIVEIGKTLGIEVVAEGVETMAHARVLKEIGCDKLQGHAFGPVLNAADLETFVRNETWRAAS